MPAVLHVTSLLDSGPGSLRAMVSSAANNDTIVFDVRGAIALSSGPILINASLFLQGPGANSLTIDGQGQGEIFDVFANLNLSGVTLQNGNNQMLPGGAIAVFGVALDVTGVYFLANRAAADGGAIGFSGTGLLQVSDSTFANNQSLDGNGGAIEEGNASAVLTNSTFVGNQAVNGFGGALDAGGPNTVITSCTFTQNVAFIGAAINNSSPSNSLSIGNSIVAGNTAFQSGPTIVGLVTSNDYNIFDDSVSATFENGPNDQLDVTPALGPLRDNGGPTSTVAVLAGSAAQNTGDPLLTGTLDQRGTLRDSAPDVGAFSSAAATSLSLVFQPSVLQSNGSYGLTITARDAQGNVASTYTGTVHFTTNGINASPPPNLTFSASAGGQLGFPGSGGFPTAGPTTLTATDTKNAALTASAGFTVVPGSLNHFGIQAASVVQAGAQTFFTVTALDAAGNIISDFAGTVHITSTDPVAVLPPDYAFVPGTDHGTHTFVMSFGIAGNQDVTFTDFQAEGLHSTKTLTVLPTLILSGPHSVVEGAPYRLDIALTPLGSTTVQLLTDDWDDGTIESFASFPSSVRHVFTDGPNFLLIDVLVTIQVGSSRLTTEQLFPVFITVPRLSQQVGAVVPAGQIALEDIAGSPGITGLLDRTQASGRATFYLALYDDNPEFLAIHAVAFYDARVNKGEVSDRLVLDFRFPPTNGALALLEFDKASKTFLPVVGSQLIVDSLRIDGSKGEIILILDDTSFPRLVNLAGTVFTVAIASSSNAVTTSFNPTLALNNGSNSLNFAQEATFQLSSQVTVALSPSQDAPQSAAQASAAVGGSGELTEEDAKKVLDIFRDVIEKLPATVPLPNLDSLKKMLQSAPPNQSSVPASDKPAGPAAAPVTAAPIVAPVRAAAPAGRPASEGALDQVMMLLSEEESLPGQPVEASRSAWMLPAPLLALLARERRSDRNGRRRFALA